MNGKRSGSLLRFGLAAVVAVSLLSDTDNVAGSLATCTSVFTTQPQRRSPALAVMR